MSGWKRFHNLPSYEPHPDTVCVCGHLRVDHIGLGSEEEHRGDGACTKCDCKKFQSIDSDKMRVICDSPHASDRVCEYRSRDDCTLKGECNWKKIIPKDSDNLRSKVTEK